MRQQTCAFRGYSSWNWIQFLELDTVPTIPCIIYSEVEKSRGSHMHLPATLNIAKLTNSSRPARLIAVLRSTDEINIAFCPQYLLLYAFRAFSSSFSFFKKVEKNKKFIRSRRWEVWFCSILGVPIPALIGPPQQCTCNVFRYDSYGDHLQTCQVK